MLAACLPAEVAEDKLAALWLLLLVAVDDDGTAEVSGFLASTEVSEVPFADAAAAAATVALALRPLLFANDAEEGAEEGAPAGNCRPPANLADETAAAAAAALAVALMPTTFAGPPVPRTLLLLSSLLLVVVVVDDVGDGASAELAGNGRKEKEKEGK